MSVGERVPDCSFEEAFMWSLSYNGYDDHVNAMIEYLEHGPRTEYGQVLYPRENVSHCVDDDDTINDRPNSILWMCMVQMFGDYGTSPRYAWIDHPDECAEWLKNLRRKTYGSDRYVYEDGSEAYCTTDEEFSAMAREWDAQQPRVPESLGLEPYQILAAAAEDEYLGNRKRRLGRDLTDEETQAALQEYAVYREALDRAFDEVFRGESLGNMIGTLSFARKNGRMSMGVDE